MTVIEAEENVVRARDALTALHRVDAVSEAEYEEAQNAKNEINAIEGTITQMEVALERAERDYKGMANEVDTLNNQIRKLKDSIPSLQDTVPCPYCGEPIVIVGRTLVKADDETEIMEKRSKIQAKIDELQDRFTVDNARLTAIREDVQDYNSNIQRDRATVIRLKKLVDRNPSLDSEDRQRGLQEAEMEISNCQSVVEMLKARENATKKHKTICNYLDTAKVLGPSGIRATLLEKGLRMMNKGLQAISDETGWQTVSIDEKGNVMVGKSKRPAALCSESERWRVQASLQLTIAALKGDPAVVLDRADLLDNNNRVALIKALDRVIAKRPMAVLVCSTGEKTPNAPWEQISIEGGNGYE